MEEKYDPSVFRNLVNVC